jgi:hypothetical protein
LSIDSAGAIARYYLAAGAYRGFVRAAHGTITMFDAHGAGAGQNTSAVSINDAGTVVGVYRHKSFRRSANGGASAAGIDNAGAIVGSYLDASDVSHGFLLQ